MNKGKEIVINRQYNAVHLAQNDPEVRDFMDQHWQGIGSYFTRGGRSIASGLTFEEEKLLLPELLGIEYTDKNFRSVVNEFYTNILTTVRPIGLKLQIGLQNDNEPLSETNRPLSLRDYIIYRHALEHPWVSRSREEAEADTGKRFYIHDPNSITREAIKLNELEDKAYNLYLKYKDSVVKVDQILTMLGVNIGKMTHEEKVLTLKTYATKDKALNDVRQTDMFKRFIKICEDKDLEYKYLIQEMIGAQYLKREGNFIVFAESGAKLGDNMEEAVLFLRSPKNSREANRMRSNYEMLVKRGIEYLPKEMRETEAKEETKA